MPLIPAEPGVHTEFKFSLGCVQDPVSNSLKTSQMRKKKMVLNSGLDTAHFPRRTAAVFAFFLLGCGVAHPTRDAFPCGCGGTKVAREVLAQM